MGKYISKHMEVDSSCRLLTVELVAGLLDDWCIHHAMYVIECQICEELFHSRRPHTLYCGNAHKQRAYRLRSGLAVAT